MIRIEKRLPFGFRGEWGKLYKLYNSPKIDGNNEVLQWQQSNYVDIGQDIQVKVLESGNDYKMELSQTVSNLVNKGEYITRKTTDAYFDTKTKTFKCVVELGDIVKLNNEFFVCDKIDAKEIVTPKKQSFYYLGLKKIFDNIITGVQNV